MNAAEFEEKKQLLSKAFAQSAQPVATRHWEKPFGQDYTLHVDDHAYYAHMQRDGSYTIQADIGRRAPILEIADAEYTQNQPEQKKVKVIADLCAQLVLAP